MRRRFPDLICHCHLKWPSRAKSCKHISIDRSMYVGGFTNKQTVTGLQSRCHHVITLLISNTKALTKNSHYPELAYSPEPSQRRRDFPRRHTSCLLEPPPPPPKPLPPIDDSRSALDCKTPYKAGPCVPKMHLPKSRSAVAVTTSPSTRLIQSTAIQSVSTA